MHDILTQYGDLMRQRADQVRRQATSVGEPDLRVGWLLWQISLRQFLYFEEEMLAPDPNEYQAEWVTRPSGGTRKESRNLWIYEKETGKKRYSVTTEAGAKIQPYFDVPPPSDPNLYLFTVIGEILDTGFVRVWLTRTTARELNRLIHSLDADAVSQAVLEAAGEIADTESSEEAQIEAGIPIQITLAAYEALRSAFPGVNDDHCFQLLAQFLQHKAGRA